MNNTITSFSIYHKYRTIPILATIQSQSSDNKLKYNYSNHLNQIESVKTSLYSNSYLPTDTLSNIKHKKNIKQEVIPSSKHLIINKRKVFNNSINLLKFNNDICSKTVNNNFIGKKIILSKFPLMNLNKISNNKKNNKLIKNLNNNDGKENKTIEINSTFFENNGFGNMNTKKGQYYLRKIEKELNDILNKTKTNKLESNGDNHKSHVINQSQNSLFNHNNDSKIKTKNENYFLNENKIINENKGNIFNKKVNRKDLFNQYLNSNVIKRKVLFIDKNNNTVSNDNTITLLSDERDYLLDKYMVQKDDKGNEVNLPLLQRYNKALDKNGKFMTDFNNKQGQQTNTTTEQTQSGSLSQLIKDRFTQQNYKNQKITGIINDYNNYNINNENKKNATMESLTMNLYKTQNPSTEKRRNRRNNNKPNEMNDILGVIKAKTIGPKTQKKKKKNISPKKKKIEDKDKNKSKKKRKLSKNLSQTDIVSSVYNIARKFSLDKDKDLKSLINIPIYVKGKRGRSIKVTLVKKANKIIPVNEKGENVTNPKLLHKFYEQAKFKINKEKEKKLLPKKRMSVNPITFFFNPIKIDIDEEDEKENENSDLSKSIAEGSNANIKDGIIIEPEKTEQKSEEKNEKPSEVKTKSSMKRKKTLLAEYNKRLSEINQPKPKVKIIAKDEKEKNEDMHYKEEDDFVKDFNFEFYSSEEEDNSVSLQKLMRLVRKKINKYLFKIFEYIAKNADIENFKKDDLTKFLIEKDFRNTFRLLKEQIIKLRELVRDSLDPEGKDKKKKIYIRDSEMINYIYRYIKDKNSLFYKSIYKRIKTEKEEEENNLNSGGNYLKIVDMLSKSYREGKKKKEFSIYAKRSRDYSEDKPHPRPSPKKVFKKKKTHRDLEVISQDEKKLLILGEINLTNEIRYQISIANDKESKEKFKNLLNKIESLRLLSGDEYVKSLKENFTMFKEEAEEILKAKEIEERLNGFIDDLNYQRNNLKDKHRYIMSLMNIKDNKFLSSFENDVSD